MEIGAILRRVDLKWFTVLIFGDRIHRYVVAVTHNTERNLILLGAQLVETHESYSNVTLGWRTDDRGRVIVDAGTSTDSYEEARRLQKQYNQISIRDSLKEEEIR